MPNKFHSRQDPAKQLYWGLQDAKIIDFFNAQKLKPKADKKIKNLSYNDEEIKTC